MDSEEVRSMEDWQNRMQQDIVEIKTLQAKQGDDIRELQTKDKLQDQEIGMLKESLKDIKEDTNWIRRKITGAIISAIITALIGGIIAIVLGNIF